MYVSVCSVDFCTSVWFGDLGAGVMHVRGAFATTIFSFRKSTDLKVRFSSLFHVLFSLFRYSPFYFGYSPFFFCFPNKVLSLGIF